MQGEHRRSDFRESLVFSPGSLPPCPVSAKTPTGAGTVAHTFDSSIREAETGRSKRILQEEMVPTLVIPVPG